MYKFPGFRLDGLSISYLFPVSEVLSRPRDRYRSRIGVGSLLITTSTRDPGTDKMANIREEMWCVLWCRSNRPRSRNTKQDYKLC